MKKNEQDILKIVKEDIENIVVPEGLSPEQMEKRLKALEKTKKNRKIYYIGGLVAACLVLVAGIYVMGTMRRPSDMEVTSVPEQKEAESTIRTAKDYEEIYTYLEAKQKENDGFTFAGFFGAGADKAEESAADTAVPMESADAYSTTNVRQEGVDEADVVKSDGRYLYLLTNDNTRIAFVDTKDHLLELNSISMEEEQYVQEFYLLPEEKKLIVICSYYKNTEAEEKEYAYAYDCLIWDNSITQVVTYDVSDIMNPKKLGMVEQSGFYTSSRMADGYVYLFSCYNTGGDFRKETPELYVPAVNDTLIQPGDIYLPPLERGCMYEVITSIDIQNPDQAADSKAIFSDGGQLYVSGSNIYYYETQWAYTNETEKTTIRKISYENGELNALAQATVSGYIKDSFCIDEYEENLRIAATVGDTNSVYVLDKELEIIGKIEGLAKEERIYSARFMGETAYFVTFYETDPLFTVDFSNPKDPQIIGKLKIPGFSDYLHFYGEGKLLGIGMAVDEEMQVTDGVKLTMFDISDRSNVKEEATYVMENVYSTDVSYDYKAALIDENKNIIGFPAYEEGGQNYYIFSYDKNNGFVCELNEEINGYGNGCTRGVYINDTLYVVQGNVVEAYSLKTFQKVDDLIL